MDWVSQHVTWLFGGGLIVVGVVGWLSKRFLDSKRETIKGEVAATSTHGNASVSDSPVASGKDIFQNVNNPTVNVAIHSDPRQVPANAAGEAALEILKSEKWPKRSFSIFKARLGGYQDDELRKLLVSVGAVRFEGKNGEELWGLRERNSETQSTSEKPTAIPSLRYVQAKQIRLGTYAGKWLESSNGDCRGIVAIFKNEPGELGQRTKTAHDVTSHLTYRIPQNQDEQELLINFGSWVGEYTRYATFSPAQTQSVIVAVQRENEFVALDNPHRTNPLEGRWRSGVVVSNPHEVNIRWLSGEVEIALLDGSGITVFQGLFAYDLDVDGQMSLKRLR